MSCHKRPHRSWRYHAASNCYDELPVRWRNAKLEKAENYFAKPLNRSRGVVSMSTVKVGNRLVGEDSPCFIIAEIGINHNGDIDLAKRLISVAVAAGCDAVKFQKRTIDVVYSADELAKPRESPFGATNGDLKRGLELDYYDYAEISDFCKSIKIPWFASP